MGHLGRLLFWANWATKSACGSPGSAFTLSGSEQLWVAKPVKNNRWWSTYHLCFFIISSHFPHVFPTSFLLSTLFYSLSPSYSTIFPSLVHFYVLRSKSIAALCNGSFIIITDLSYLDLLNLSSPPKGMWEVQLVLKRHQRLGESIPQLNYIHTTDMRHQ